MNEKYQVADLNYVGGCLSCEDRYLEHPTNKRLFPEPCRSCLLLSDEKPFWRPATESDSAICTEGAEA